MSTLRNIIADLVVFAIVVSLMLSGFIFIADLVALAVVALPMLAGLVGGV